MIGNFTEVLGDTNSNDLNSLDLEIVFGLANDDTLSSSFGLLPEGESTTILVGGSGNDLYNIANNSTAVIFDNSFSNQDTIIATGINTNNDLFLIVEIDGRHLYVGDRDSSQYVILLDWQQPQNRIENIVLANGNFSYNDLVNSFRQVENYFGDFTWEELVQIDEINIERLGLFPSSINDAINQVSARATELENPSSSVIDPNSDLNTPINRFQSVNVPGTYLYAGPEESQNIRQNFSNSFIDEGLAFSVSTTPGPNLVPINRYQSTRNPSTYLFSTAGNFQQDSRITQSDFFLEGQAFYTYGANSGLGTDFYRFENTDRPGTYLFVGPSERVNILQNFTGFEDQGAVWAV